MTQAAPELVRARGAPITAVPPSADSATELTDAGLIMLGAMSPGTSLWPIWFQTPPVRPKVHTAPTAKMPGLSPGPTMKAVLPSADRATVLPKPTFVPDASVGT